MYERFDIDYKKAIQEQGLEENQKIDCAEMSKLYLRLGFLTPDGGHQERAHLASIWNSIGGDAQGEDKVPLQHAKVYMCAI
jgi:hypothetical protein